MKKLLTTACLFVVTVVAIVSFTNSAIFAQELKSAESKPLIDEITTAKVDKLFEKWNKPDSPGCALGIVKDGRLIYKRGYGMANLDHNIPISSKSVFQIESISKQFTAMSILILFKQGKLSLDDEIQKYLPEIPRYQSPITIRHLIHHTHGIRDYDDLADLAGMALDDVHLTDDDFLGLLARQKYLNFKPGEEFSYNNVGYFLQGLIVKRVSGRSLRKFADENIFKPLGMNNTHFHDDRNLVVKNRATYYHGSNGGFSAFIYNSDSVGAWGLFTSVEDLFLWDQNFYNNKLGGGADLIKEQLSTGRLNNGEKVNYAFGLEIREYKGLKTIQHGGGVSFKMTRFPEQNFSVICLCNTGYNLDPIGLSNQVADIFLADQFKKVPDSVKETAAAATDIISIPEKELTSLAGLYVDPTNVRRQLRFYMENGKLFYRAGTSVRRLSPVSKNRFRVVGVGAPVGVEMVFERSDSRGPMQMKLISSGRTTTFDAVNSETPTLAQLAEFTGKYLSDELPGATYTLSIKDGKIILQVRNGISVFSGKALVLAWAQPSGSESPEDNLLTPAFADAFFAFSGSIIVRFTRNQQNAVSGFTLTAGNAIRRLRFNKN